MDINSKARVLCSIITSNQNDTYKYSCERILNIKSYLRNLLSDGTDFPVKASKYAT